ncbi:D-glycero-alpha-D-manno-heptose-1,7-bisphosphate 7-phosphatase [Sedimentisphaera salicampi]|uniref:D,D-heptose 1,7-bisphosphate phosphatase n=1 Tax=Sedimentisphaera salicampi TaxID=1941349 RepID=A0A1W6LJ26_9BACT|nr:HAD-IIIA family hydrolase [Sedimentisphaera salicampi]ARN55743.1 D,D-heptose 1,7-bisphosphate phosphatase [Sedimentisphaera salicampi]OXU15939.1 D,D-heptose 1,7-bisphosphate phosphatase [Sedimentisphaera salicampi]
MKNLFGDEVKLGQDEGAKDKSSASEDFDENHKIKAVFLDRDNTIISDPGYISKPEQVKLIQGAGKALRCMQQLGYKLFVVTNQSGIARGLLTEERLDEIHSRLKSLLMQEGVELEGIYYCPYHPEGELEEYRMESFERKPAPGMILQAAEEHNIALEKSWLIGDRYRDIKAGRAAGCCTILINLPGNEDKKDKSDPPPDYAAVNIKEAANIIMMYHHKKEGRHKVLDIGSIKTDSLDELPNGSSDISQIAHILERMEENILSELQRGRDVFSKWKVFAAAVQVISLVCLLIALIGVFASINWIDSVLTPLVFAAVLQLMAISAYLISKS